MDHTCEICQSIGPVARKSLKAGIARKSSSSKMSSTVSQEELLSFGVKLKLEIVGSVRGCLTSTLSKHAVSTAVMMQVGSGVTFACCSQLHTIVNERDIPSTGWRSPDIIVDTGDDDFDVRSTRSFWVQSVIASELGEGASLSVANSV